MTNSEKLAESAKRAYAEAEGKGMTALEDFPGVNKPWKLGCRKCGSVVTPKWDSVRRGRGPCRNCGIKRRAASRLRNNGRRAVQEAEALGMDPLEDFPGIDSPWKMRCRKCESVVTPNWHSVRGGQGPCNKCGIRARSQLRLGESEARAMKEAAEIGFMPTEPYPGANSKWHGIHLDCWSDVSPRWGGVRNGQGCCRTCAEYGYNPSQPGSLYLVYHAATRTLKVGISNKLDRRLKDHEANGYDPEAFVFATHEDGQWAQQAEKRVLTALREAGYQPVEDAPKNGWTETFPAAAYELARKLMMEVARGVS